jgi:plasmid stability protein
MAMNLRLTDEETAALRRKAAEEGRSMQEVARAAISEYVSDSPSRRAEAIVALSQRRSREPQVVR